MRDMTVGAASRSNLVVVIAEFVCFAPKENRDIFVNHQPGRRIVIVC